MCKVEECACAEEEKLRQRLAQATTVPSVEPEKSHSQAGSLHSPPPSAKRGFEEANGSEDQRDSKDNSVASTTSTKAVGL